MTTQKEAKEKEKASRETLGKFFYDLAKATFTVMVLTNAIALFTTDDYIFSSIMFVIGITATSVLARIGYLIFKR